MNTAGWHAENVVPVWRPCLCPGHLRHGASLQGRRSPEARTLCACNLRPGALALLNLDHDRRLRRSAQTRQHGIRGVS